MSTVNVLDAAITLARKGFHVFPLRPNSKLPSVADFKSKATSDETQITKWFAPGSRLNLAISTSSFREKQYLCVIDVDNKNGKNGDAEISRLEMVEGLVFPETFTQITPTGGRHLVYKTPFPCKQGVHVLGKGIDVRAYGGYVVGAGSTIGDAHYVGNDCDVSDAPEWLIEKIGKFEAPSSDSSNEPRPSEVRLDPAVSERIVRYLKHEKPAIEGQGGNQATFTVAAFVKDAGATKEECLALMLEHYNPRCEPPWGYSELSAIVNNAYQYGKNAAGSQEVKFEEVLDGEEKILHDMNKNYALVYFGGSHSVLFETVDEKGHAITHFLQDATFKEKFRNKVVHGPQNRPTSWANLWLNWEGRREYAGVVFAPERKAQNGYYNLWRGFTVKPLTYNQAKKEHVEGLNLFLDHAKNNICRGIESDFKWLMGYFAHLVQKPFERPLTTVVFKGSKGVGKNALVDRVGHLLGESHYTTVHHPRYLEGQFNSHMEGNLVLVLDEAFWSGHKSTDAALKSITTNPRIRIERKGKDSYVADNLSRLIVIGNEEWLVPASSDERRYAVFTVGEAKKQDRKYFARMRECLDDLGGSGLLLHYLQTFDLTSVDINEIPQTEGLYEQKVQTLNYFQEWWYGCLKENELKHSGLDGWPKESIKTEVVFEAFKHYLRSRHVNKLPHDTRIGVDLKRSCPSMVKKQVWEDGKRHTTYEFPTIEAARRDWEKEFRVKKLDWNNL